MRALLVAFWLFCSLAVQAEVINVWLALRDDAQALIKERLSWDEDTQGEYTGPVSNRQHRLFSLMSDQANVQRLFRVDTDGARDWTLWSIYFNEERDILLKVVDELDTLVTVFPNHIKIVGAWHFDGRQIRQGGAVLYPIHPRILELMPDIVIYDSDGNEVNRIRPSAPSDVNLLAGQSPRDFTP